MRPKSAIYNLKSRPPSTSIESGGLLGSCLSVYLSVTSQLTVESRIDRPDPTRHPIPYPYPFRRLLRRPAHNKREGEGGEREGSPLPSLPNPPFPISYVFRRLLPELARFMPRGRIASPDISLLFPRIA